MAEMRDKTEVRFKAVGKDKQVHLIAIKDRGHVCFIDIFNEVCEIIILFLMNENNASPRKSLYYLH
jgi:hypothetical protein